MLAKIVKDLKQMSLELFCIVVIIEYIVKLHQHKVVNGTRRSHINKMLEGRRCIAQSKQKHSIIKYPISCDKCGLFTSMICQLDLVLATSQVNHGQKACLWQLVKQVIYARQWIDIFLCLSVQHSVINCHSQLPSLLPNEDYGSPIGQARWMNPPPFKIFVKLLSHFR